LNKISALISQSFLRFRKGCLRLFYLCLGKSKMIEKSSMVRKRIRKRLVVL
jgi:hypothetical protein